MKHSRSSSETENIHLFIQSEPSYREATYTTNDKTVPFPPGLINSEAWQDSRLTERCCFTLLYYGLHVTVVNCSNHDEGTELLIVFFVSGRCRVTEPEVLQPSSSPCFERK